MARASSWHLALLCLGAASGLGAVTPTAHAGSDPSASAPAPLMGRVEVAMLGESQRDPVLFERIRSLFLPQTQLVERGDRQLDQRSVLRPPRADTVYIWIRVSDGAQARVYLALAEHDRPPRYLFREVTLESGLDEVGAETLAEVAHSSARALWLREQQSSREAVVAALERETTRARPRLEATTTPVVAAPGRATDASTPALPSSARREAPALRLGFGASAVSYGSGTEGLLSEVGGVFLFEFRGRFALRGAARYLVPTDFALPPARVHLNGAAGELRAGWLTSDARRPRFRLEAGFGVLLGRARATIVDAAPAAHPLGARGFERAYALAAVAFEWPIGPAWIAAGADLRVPLMTTSYEVSGQRGAGTSSALCPGGALEVGIGFDPAPR